MGKVRSIEENGNERRRKQGGVYWVISWGGGRIPDGKERGSRKWKRKERGKWHERKKDAEVGRME